jgi:putative lipase involved disintegration of autophagic bodies
MKKMIQALLFTCCMSMISFAGFTHSGCTKNCCAGILKIKKANTKIAETDYEEMFSPFEHILSGI